MFEKNCHEYIYVHDLDFPLMRERFSKFDIHKKKK